MQEINSLIKSQLQKRQNNPGIPAIKVNLYNSLEVRAVKQAIDRLEAYRGFDGPDCFMVGDSLLTTHLGRQSTRLETIAEQDKFLDQMLDSVRDVRTAIDELFSEGHRPYLMGDLPDGSSASAERLIMVSENMLQHGADIVKLEIAQKSDLALIELLEKHNIPVAVHVGYAPQKNNNRQYGQTLQETLDLIELVRLAKDWGASAIIVERIAEVVNHILCKPSGNNLPVYSIFSGKAPGGGQSLNVWDAVYKPGFKSFFFPPTATLTTETYPETYTLDRITEKFYQLLKLALDGEFPKSPNAKLSSEDIKYLEALDVWSINPVEIKQ